MIRSIAAPVTAAALVVTVGVTLSQRTMQSTFAARRADAARERLVAAATERAFKLTLDLETGVRGFLLTRDERFLEPYQQARATLTGELDTLHTQLAGDDGRLEKVDDVERHIDGWLRDAADVEIAAARAGRPTAELTPQLARDKAMMDATRAAFSRLSAEETRAREANEAALEERARQTSRIVAFSASLAGLIALAVGILVSVALRRGVARLVAVAERVARGEFTTPIPDEREALAPLVAALRAMSGSLSEREAQAETLLAVSRVAPMDLDELLAHVRASLLPLVDAAAMMLVDVEPTSLRQLACWPATLGVTLGGDEPLAPARSAASLAMARGELVSVEDARDDRYCENAVARAAGQTSYVVLPLRDHVARALVLVLRDGRAPGPGLRRFLTILSHQLGATVANARLTLELEARNRELERASRAKSQFLALMSHELRTPLNSIIGFSDVLGDGKFGVLGERQARYVRNINDSGRHLLRLINDLLDMSKIEAGRLEVLRERCPLAPLVAEVVAQLQPLADEKQIVLTPPSESALPPVWADPLRIKQVLLNLVGNAVKFTPPGGRVSLSMETLPSLHDLRLTVEDSGPGIEPEDLKKLFQPFSQLQNARAEGGAGTGLGLALVKQLVELMDGRVFIESTPGKGSRFVVDLRIAPIEDPAPVSDAPPDAPLVLIVDDDPAARELMRLTLDSARLRSHAVGTGEEALAAARRLKPAVILLDVFLPDRDGWTVLGQLRADPETSELPVVLVTISNDRQRSFSLGAVDHLIKPVGGDALLAALARRGFLAHARGGNVRVLVVDDDARHCELMRATLEPRGFAVHVAQTGREGLALAAKEPLDIVLLDLVLPDISGIDVAVTLRGDEKTRHVPIVLLTANTVEARDRARLNGSVAAILAKSATGTNELLAEVRRAMSLQ